MHTTNSIKTSGLWNQILLRWKFFAVAAAALPLVVWLVWQAVHQDPLLRYRSGIAAISVGDGDTAFREAASLLKSPGFEAWGHLLRGQWFLKTEKYAAAAREFGLATENEQTRAEAYTRGGEAFYRMQQFVDAEKMLLMALESDPESSDARRWLASTYYDLGAMSLAMDQLQIVGVRNPTDGRPYRLRGLIQKDFKQFGEAVTEYQESLKRELIPDQRQAVLRELAECLVQQLQYEQALEVLQTAAETAESLVIEAQCFSALGNTDEALKKTNAALQLDPDHRAAVLTKAAVLLETNHAEDAVSMLEAAVQRHSNDFDLLFQLNKAWRLTGRTAEAEAHAAKLAELEKLVDEFAELNSRAFDDLENSELRFQLGQLALRLDRPELARSWLQAAHAMNPAHSETRKLLESLQSQTSSASDVQRAGQRTPPGNRPSQNPDKP
jgi:tetratricopeptide (TPR) repeat protein